MKVLMPQVSWHDRERVSSVDFQPKNWPEGAKSGANNRLASAGDDQHVVIWNLHLDDEGKVQLDCLADLTRHQNSVNIVRWSKDGKMLASGDTDSAIFIWHYLEKDVVPELFGDDPNSGNSESSENWSIYKTLRGHLQDVVSLEFSPCGKFLISCSTDNTAIIFDVNKGSKVKMLTEHKGWVNGVAWDPLEKFVASIASDRVLRVFKTKTFKNVSKTYKCKLLLGNETKTSEDDTVEPRNVRLFHDDTFQSFYRRLSFSPDGQLLVVPSGVLDVDGEPKVTNCTYVFSRTDFTKPVLYLPNKEFSVAIRFSPIRYQLRKINKSETNKLDQEAIKPDPPLPWEKYESLFRLPYRLVYAIASQNTVSFYDTQQSEPFARVSKIHYIGLTDLTWSADGCTLLVSSSDGFCSLISFKEGEIGDAFQEEPSASAPEPNIEKQEQLDEKVTIVPDKMEIDSVSETKTKDKVASLIAVRRK